MKHLNIVGEEITGSRFGLLLEQPIVKLYDL